MGHSPDGRRRTTADLIRVDDATCTVLHVDMDAFFAAVELRRRPELAGRPMMVAGEGRAVVLSATYEARRHGVRSAMPVGQAFALCPDIVRLPPDLQAYQAASEQVMALFAEVTPAVEPVSIDEAFLDIGGARRIGGRPAAIAARLRQRVSTELGLTASIGAAATKFVAKLASGLAKPDGLLIVPTADVPDLLRPLPVRAIWGVGPKTAESLTALGLLTVGEVADAPRLMLEQAFGALGAKLHALANGVDDRPVRPASVEVSIGAETTFDRDLGDRDRLLHALLLLCDRTAQRARGAGLVGRTVTLKVRYADFSIVNRSAALGTPTDSAQAIHQSAGRLLRRVDLVGRRVRLVGVRLDQLSRLADTSQQLQFGTESRPGPDWRRAEGVVDEVATRFGRHAVQRASTLPTDRSAGSRSGTERSSSAPD